MEDMNIEFDIEDDLIKKFLLHKLNEIKLNNMELEQQIDRRKELVNGCVSKMASEFGQNILEITDVWQRSLNDKWIVGLKVINTSSIGVSKNTNVILKWDSPKPFTYCTRNFCRFKEPPKHQPGLSEKLKKIVKRMEVADSKKFHTLNDEWIETAEVQQCVSVVVTLEIPDFAEKSTYKISGILNYDLGDKYCQLNIPDFEINASDVTNKVFAVKELDVIGGQEQAYLSTLVTNEQTQLVAQVSQNTYTSLDNILEFECRFRKVDVVSRTKFFFVTAVADSIDGSLLELQQENDTIYNLNIFSRNQKSLQLLLYYLHQNIKNILILPRESKPNLMQEPAQQNIFLTQVESAQDDLLKSKLTELGKALESQINLVEKFCLKRLDEVSIETSDRSDEIDLNVQEYQDFRKQLADLELNSDLLYVSVEQLTGKLEPSCESSQE